MPPPTHKYAVVYEVREVVTTGETEADAINAFLREYAVGSTDWETMRRGGYKVEPINGGKP